jgi:hypothetical protein
MSLGDSILLRARYLPETIIAQESTSSTISGFRELFWRPAKANTGKPSAAVKRCGCLWPGSPVHP